MVKLTSLLAFGGALVPAVVGSPINSTEIGTLPGGEMVGWWTPIRINCKAVCSRPEEEVSNACDIACRDNEDDLDAEVRNVQLAPFALALFSDDTEVINYLSNTDTQGLKRYILNHLDPKFLADSKSLLIPASNTTTHHFDKRKTTKINCWALCHEDNPIYNLCACGAACRYYDQFDCKEKVFRMETLKHLTRCLFYRDDWHAKYSACKHAKHRHKCFQDLFDNLHPGIHGRKHSHPVKSCTDFES